MSANFKSVHQDEVLSCSKDVVRRRREKEVESRLSEAKMTSLLDGSSDRRSRDRWIRRIAIVGLFLAILFSLPSAVKSQCPTEDDDKESLVPFPPSIQPLEYLKLLEYNGPEFRLSCELLVCSITKPIKYNWFFAKFPNETGKELAKSGHEDAQSENYHFEREDLIIHADYGDWNALTGYYWCTAQNEHGMASSTKCLVDKTKVKTRPDDLEPMTVQSGESFHVAMEKPPLTPEDVPLNVFYTVSSLDGKTTEILSPKAPLESKDGRFVIGDNFDLYVQDAKTSDSCKVTQFFQEYGTMTNFAYRTAQINVENTHFLGEKSGFFDGYKDYLFIRKKENSYITCIPRSPGKVKFQKDGKDLKLSENNKDDVYRTDYAIWFRNPLEENSGDYSCLMEDDTSIKVTKNLRVIGAPLMKCDFYVFIIRTPGDAVKMSCTVTSDFLTLNEPQIYLNDKPFEPSQSDVSFKKSVKKTNTGYTVEVTSSKLTEKDNGVFRFVGSSAPMTKEDVMTKMKYDPVKDIDRVYFNDYRVLPFESREEVSVAVFVMPLKIKDHDKSERLDALVGEENFIVRSIIYGSPLPDVQWLVDGEEIDDKNPLYAFRTKLTVVFDFLIKKVEKSVNITAFGTHTIENKLHHVSDLFNVQAHEPIEWQPDLPESANTITGRDANVFCAATQKGGVLTGTVLITWLRAKDMSQIFSGSGGFEITGGKTVIGGNTYSTSNLTFPTTQDSQHKFVCVGKLIAAGKYILQTIQHNVSVETGAGPKSPMDLKYEEERRLFIWTAERIAYDYEMKDVVQVAEVFQETENREHEFKELGSTTMYLGSAGIRDIKASLGELTNYEMQELPTGAKFKFRVYTQNKYGKSGFSNTIETITPDSEPTQKLMGVTVKPTDDGSSKIVVSWDLYPREQFGSFEKKGCCIHVEVEAVTRSGEAKTLNLDCVDPEATEVETGWPDLEPYTKHKVKTWFSNDAGETDKNEVEGYNAEAKPSEPKLSGDQPEEQPREVSVEFDSMTDEDMNGKFKDYQLIIRDENGEVVGNIISTEQGNPGEKVKLTVDGLKPFSNYTAELIVRNQEYVTTTGQMPKQTVATKPEKIDPDSIRVIVHPEGVVMFWEPTEPNGIFKDYLIKFQDFGGTEKTTVAPFFDATNLFFDKDGNPTADVKGYPFDVAAQNHEYTGDPTTANVDFSIITTPPENPRPPVDWRCDLEDPPRLGTEWTYKEFGNYATSHSIIYATIDEHTNATEEEEDRRSASEKLEDYNESCDPTYLTDTQHCYPEVHQEPGKFLILLLARNKFGASMSSPRLCKATWPSAGFLEPGTEMQTFSTAGATLIMALILLIVLLIILTFIAVYYTKNRSHNYRVQKTESRFKPKDIEFLPRKDETNKFNEYVPDETMLPFISPHKHTGPVDLETDSFDGPYGGDEDLDGYNEDGSFIGAYVEDNVYRSA